MRGGFRCSSLSIFLVSMLLACGDDRRTGAATADSARLESPAAGAADTTPTAATDSALATADRGDSTPPAQKPAAKPAPEVARATPPAKAPTPSKPATPPPSPEPAAPTPEPAAPTPEPAAPTPEPPAPASADTPPATPSTEAADPAPQTQAAAPLRDQYHRAPLDTVPQQVYDGWKQYNLNCARCHGEDVLGTTIAPHLLVSVKPGGPINSKELFVQTVCAGRPEKGMPAWCPLGMEMDKIEAIYAYVKGRSDGKLRPGRPALREG